MLPFLRLIDGVHEPQAGIQGVASSGYSGNPFFKRARKRTGPCRSDWQQFGKPPCGSDWKTQSMSYSKKQEKNSGDSSNREAFMSCLKRQMAAIYHACWPACASQFVSEPARAEARNSSQFSMPAPFFDDTVRISIPGRTR